MLEEQQRRRKKEGGRQTVEVMERVLKSVSMLRGEADRQQANSIISGNNNHNCNNNSSSSSSSYNRQVARELQELQQLRHGQHLVLHHQQHQQHQQLQQLQQQQGKLERNSKKAGNGLATTNAMTPKPLDFGGSPHQNNGHSGTPYDLGRKLRPCQHQVAGHLFENGKAGSLVDDSGHFYKPLQVGPRGAREHSFYITAFSTQGGDRQGGGGPSDGVKMPTANVPAFVPRYFGTVELAGRRHLVLEDLGVGYSKPCVIDIKIGYQTWYECGDERYVRRARAKDEATTQASLGFKICGWQAYKHNQNGFWRASKRWCKTLSQGQVRDALLNFGDNGAGLRPADVYGHESYGALTQLRELQSWFQMQRDFLFYSSSVLILYEGDAEAVEDSNVRVRLVDFAHTFEAKGRRDNNFLRGLSSLIQRLEVLIGEKEGL